VKLSDDTSSLQFGHILPTACTQLQLQTQWGFCPLGVG